MIKTPDRLAEIASAIKKGEQVDLRKYATLQALDLVRAGREFAELAVAEQEAEYERIKQRISGT